jgi:hypothetical protein
MSRLRAGVVLLLIQLALVLSVAGKYLYERQTRPRVWVRAAQVDPSQPLRGRYLALQPLLNACDLPKDAARTETRFLPSGKTAAGWWVWSVSLDVVGGHLVPRLAQKPRNAMDTHTLRVGKNSSCELGELTGTGMELFLSEGAKTPFPLKPGQELWVEVTVPKQGPPRPIQLALSDASGFHPLKFN